MIAAFPSLGTVHVGLVYHWFDVYGLTELVESRPQVTAVLPARIVVR